MCNRLPQHRRKLCQANVESNYMKSPSFEVATVLSHTPANSKDINQIRIQFIYICQFTCVGNTCWPQCRWEYEIIGALFGKFGDSVENTTWSQSIETAPWLDFGPNGSTLHRHGYRNAELSSGHGCQFNGLPAIIETLSQHKSSNFVLHLCSIIFLQKKQQFGMKFNFNNYLKTNLV